MKSTTLIAVLVRLTTAMAAAAPLIVFGFLYVLAVEPERAAARASQQRLVDASAERARQRTLIQRSPSVVQVSAIGQFDSRTIDPDSAGEVAEALEALLRSPAVGGVADLSIETGAAVDEPLDPRILLFGRELVSTPVTASFEAGYDQIGRFFWNLRMLPTTFELRSVELEPGGAGLMHARVVLFAVHRKPQAQQPMDLRPPIVADLLSAPEWKRNPFTAFSDTPSPPPAARKGVLPRDPEPVVSSILYSSGRRVARVDGRIVRAGDRVGSAVVRSIEADAVVFSTADGQQRRVELHRPTFRMVGR
jgi:hypothetical protein